MMLLAQATPGGGNLVPAGTLDKLAGRIPELVLLGLIVGMFLWYQHVKDRRDREADALHAKLEHETELARNAALEKLTASCHEFQLIERRALETVIREYATHSTEMRAGLQEAARMMGQAASALDRVERGRGAGG